jgi:hypothetical protein
MCLYRSPLIFGPVPLSLCSWCYELQIRGCVWEQAFHYSQKHKDLNLDIKCLNYN